MEHLYGAFPIHSENGMNWKLTIALKLNTHYFKGWWKWQKLRRLIFSEQWNCALRLLPLIGLIHTSELDCFKHNAAERCILNRQYRQTWITWRFSFCKMPTNWFLHKSEMSSFYSNLYHISLHALAIVPLFNWNITLTVSICNLMEHILYFLLNTPENFIIFIN